MNELTYENATHLLQCAHQVGWRKGMIPNARREYTMRCHILKDMGDGRIKILVFGERNWKGKEHISHVRYVPKSRLTRRAGTLLRSPN